MKKRKGTCSLGQKDAPLKHQLIELFWTLGPAYARWAEAHMYQPGVTPHRMRLMTLLYEQGPMMMSSLRDGLGVTATNITALVDALEKNEMVIRKPHPTDRRATMIELTLKAKKQLADNCVKFKDRVSELFIDFSQAEQEQFLKFLFRMKEALIKRGILEGSGFNHKNR